MGVFRNQGQVMLQSLVFSDRTTSALLHDSQSYRMCTLSHIVSHCHIVLPTRMNKYCTGSSNTLQKTCSASFCFLASTVKAVVCAMFYLQKMKRFVLSLTTMRTMSYRIAWRKELIGASDDVQKLEAEIMMLKTCIVNKHVPSFI